MSLSPEVQQRLDKAHEKQFINPRNKDTLHTIATCAFVGLQGPFQSGKTALGLEAVRLDPDNFHYVPSTTNREKRDDEPESTVHIIKNNDEDMTRLLDDMAHGDLVQYVIHPTTGRFYGTYATDLRPGKYNLMPLLAGKPADYTLGSPFVSTQAIGIVNNPDILRQRIERAYRDAPAEKLEQRLIEGVNSAKALVTQHKLGKLSLLYNMDGELEHSARILMDMIKNPTRLKDSVEMLEDMLRQVNGETNV